MNIEQGLFKFDFTDYHAILGVPLDADAKQIRKRYLRIARKLHPDALATASEMEKQQASDFLSKMVNPAYEKLTQEKEMAEYQVILRMKGQTLSKQAANLDLQTNTAKELLGANNALNLYSSDLSKLADLQYESLEQVLEITGQISELNLAYLVQSEGGCISAPPTSDKGSDSDNSVSRREVPKPPPPPNPRQQRESIIGSYLKRARQFELKKDYSRAILEMREAVKAHPNSAPCHAQLASIYLQAGQPKMARIHWKRAVELDPENALVKQLEPKVNQANKGKPDKKQSGSKGVTSGSRGGLFGLFGGKQK